MANYVNSLSIIGLLLPLLISAKYSQRIFVDFPNAITYVDHLKTGFRLVLDDAFINSQLSTQNFPTIFITAIPLHSDEQRSSRVLYPESISADKQIKIDGLREHSWYYVCIEWESITRHNETTGTVCHMYQTLDRFGKSSDSVVTDLEIQALTDTSLAFRLRTEATFPVRVTTYLKGAQFNPAAQVFHLTTPKAIDVLFPFLRPDTVYGQLCIVEEPLISAYSAMGRLIFGLKTEKCYFDELSTQPGHIISTERELLSNEIRAYKHVMSGSGRCCTGYCSNLIAAFITLLLSVWLR